MLQADPKESLALALLQALRAGHPTTTAVHVSHRTFLIDELLQLQLEEPGARDLQSHEKYITYETAVLHQKIHSTCIPLSSSVMAKLSLNGPASTELAS